jgi:hypothetical protein
MPHKLVSWAHQFHGHNEAIKIEYDDPKMKNNFYDIAFTSNTYHHIENRVEYLKKVKSGLKKLDRF